ncbi:uncharacterized protein [Temnothorax nylanderi]|uniref:uncharacterized protein n=1 Tax=Temnothorax nylanderi TaxID=102681 RepID=UPI003A851F36
MQEPSTSESVEQNISDSNSEAESLGKDDDMKNNLTNALIYCKSLLEAENLLTNTPPAQISHASIAMGEAIFNEIMFMLDDRKIIIDEDLIGAEDIDIDNAEEYEECIPRESPEFQPELPFSRDYEYIPLSYKEKAVALAEMHPQWTLKTLQRQGCHKLKNKKMLRIWKEDVKRGGTKIDKWKYIETQTFEHFTEARQCLEQITTRTLQQWAMATAFPLLNDNFSFSASSSWTDRFKQKYKIRQRKITRYISNRDHATLEETLEAAERFQTQTRAIMPEFDCNFIINTDQTGCQYQIPYNRSLAPKGSKTVFIKKKSLHNISHSYTAQYAITASGKMLPVVFLCMQESTGKFGPTVQKKVDTLISEYKNVFVSCSKSGKLTKHIYTDYLKYCLSPYVVDNKFLLLIDSWGGQTDLTLYDDIFEDETNRASCTVKVIPPKCTPLCQPCNVYFYRQVKNFIKRLQNCSFSLQQQREIGTREDAIKIHSLLLHQLSAPVFQPMLLYAWYASKLIEERPIFLNMNDICFPITVVKKLCICKSVGFIQCAHCKKILCFECFYDKYHPKTCNLSHCESDSEDE